MSVGGLRWRRSLRGRSRAGFALPGLAVFVGASPWAPVLRALGSAAQLASVRRAPCDLVAFLAAAARRFSALTVCPRACALASSRLAFCALTAAEPARVRGARRRGELRLRLTRCRELAARHAVSGHGDTAWRDLSESLAGLLRPPADSTSRASCRPCSIRRLRRLPRHRQRRRRRPPSGRPRRRARLRSCRLRSRPVPTPAPTATAPAPAPAALIGTTAAVAVPSNPLNSVSDTGMGTRASPRSAERWRCCRRAKLAQSGHSARWSRRRRRSFRPSRSSTDCDTASCASVHVSWCSSSSASDRRARNRSVSSADVVTPRMSAISVYERPSNSRRTIACRCCGGIFESAVSSSPTLGPSSSSGVLRACGDPVVELDLARPRLLLSEALLDRVARDRQQPVRRLSRLDALLERAVRVQERRLRDVLGVRVVPEDGERVAVDLGDVGAIEVVDLARGEMAGLGYGHALATVVARRTSRNPPHTFLTRERASSASRRRRLHECDMTRTLIVLAAFLTLSVPAALAAPPEGKGKPESPGKSAAAPGQSADKNAAKKCKAERASMGVDAFKPSTARTRTRRTPSASASPAEVEGKDKDEDGGRGRGGGRPRRTQPRSARPSASAGPGGVQDASTARTRTRRTLSASASRSSRRRPRPAEPTTHQDPQQGRRHQLRR